MYTHIKIALHTVNTTVVRKPHFYNSINFTNTIRLIINTHIITTFECGPFRAQQHIFEIQFYFVDYVWHSVN